MRFCPNLSVTTSNYHSCQGIVMHPSLHAFITRSTHTHARTRERTHTHRCGYKLNPKRNFNSCVASKREMMIMSCLSGDTRVGAAINTSAAFQQERLWVSFLSLHVFLVCACVFSTSTLQLPLVAQNHNHLTGNANNMYVVLSVYAAL